MEIQPKRERTYDFDYEVNERGRVIEVMRVHGRGGTVSESMVYGLDTEDPYTRKGGVMYYLSDDNAKRAREAREAYRRWKSGRGVNPDWAWEEVK